MLDEKKKVRSSDSKTDKNKQRVCSSLTECSEKQMQNEPLDRQCEVTLSVVYAGWSFRPTCLLPLWCSRLQGYVGLHNVTQIIRRAAVNSTYIYHAQPRANDVLVARLRWSRALIAQLFSRTPVLQSIAGGCCHKMRIAAAFFLAAKCTFAAAMHLCSFSFFLSFLLLLLLYCVV